MTNNHEYFDFGLWWGKIFTSVYGLRDLLLYLGDKDSIDAFLKKNYSIVSFIVYPKSWTSGLRK